MSVFAGLIGLAFLMLVAYRGFSVILFAPLAAMIPILLTHPSQVPEVFTGLYMEKTVYFVKLYFPLFLLGAVFGKLIELSGFAQSIVSAVAGFLGVRRTILAIALVCALLTYGGVSLFVVVFAVYPFAAEMFRQAQLPKRLIPATLNYHTRGHNGLCLRRFEHCARGYVRAIHCDGACGRHPPCRNAPCDGDGQRRYGRSSTQRRCYYRSRRNGFNASAILQRCLCHHTIEDRSSVPRDSGICSHGRQLDKRARGANHGR